MTADGYAAAERRACGSDADQAVLGLDWVDGPFLRGEAIAPEVTERGDLLIAGSAVCIAIWRQGRRLGWPA